MKHFEKLKKIKNLILNYNWPLEHFIVLEALRIMKRNPEMQEVDVFQIACSRFERDIKEIENVKKLKFPLIAKEKRTGELYLFGDRYTATCITDKPPFKNLGVVYLDGSIESDPGDRSKWTIYGCVRVSYNQ